jgi:hypothetical protein
MGHVKGEDTSGRGRANEGKLMYFLYMNEYGTLKLEVTIKVSGVGEWMG